MAQTAKKRRYEFDAYVFRRGAHWYAECPDLSLVTMYATPQEALDALAVQVQLYIEARLEAGEEHLILRPSPPLYQQAAAERRHIKAARGYPHQQRKTLRYEGGSVAYA